MSLDIYLENNFCPHCERGDVVMHKSMTHNVSLMWREAGVYSALYQSDGDRASDHIMALSAGLRDMQTNREKYEALNPANGWGDYDTATLWLGIVLSHFVDHPDSVIRVCS